MKLNIKGPKSGLILPLVLIFSGSVVAPTFAVSGPNTPKVPVFSSQALETPIELRAPQRNEVVAARSHLARNASAWGVNPEQFVVTQVIQGQSGMSTIRFIQKISDVEVVGSLLAITVSGTGALLSHTLEAASFSGVITPLLSPAQALEKTKAALAPGEITVNDIELVIADSQLVTEILQGQKLVWRSTTLINGNIISTATTYLDDASGTLISSLPLVRGITAEPLVCDLQSQLDNAARGVVDIGGSKFVNIGSGALMMPLCGLTDAVTQNEATGHARTHITKTWDFFSSLGIDINEEKFLGNVSPLYNGDTTPRISAFVNVCATGASLGNQCPFVNAFWVPWTSPDCASGACSGIFLGASLGNADDVISHELAHGVTFSLAFNAGLVDTSETAALSEAISDIFGEATDQLTTEPGELADPTWTLGEDAVVGGFRSMQSPSVARITKNWKPADSHENSGPVNRLAWLLASGGNSGKTKVKAVSKDPATALRMVSAMTLTATSHLTQSASYIDFGREFMNACAVNLANKTPGYSKKVCTNVSAAIKAQGFAKFSIQGITKVGTVAKNAETLISATAVSSTGSPFSGQQLVLQYKKGNSWKTIAKGNTDGNGNISFNVAWAKSVSYRITSKTNGGLFTANSKTAKVKVK